MMGASAPVPPPPTSQLLGHQIGPYRIVSFLGAGGMAEVYVGEHVDPQLGRRVAIKALRPELCQQQALVDRFMNEARALGRIRHPGVVDIFEVDRLPDGRVCLVMELLRGEPLAAYLKSRGRLPVDEAIAIAAQIASAMSAAHAQRIIHRDLKPDNVFVSTGADGLHVRILDFGVAKLLDGAGEVQTGTRTTLGTAAYMAPEQFRSSRDVDTRADVYALGCLLFEMVTGGPPYPARTLAEQMAGHAFAAIPSAADKAGAPPLLDAVLTRMMAKDRDDRYASMQEVMAALGQVSAGAVAWSDDTAAGATATSMRPLTAPPAMITDRVAATGGTRWWPLIAIAVALAAALGAGLALR
jgi:serine/threonine protein kinase